MSDPYIGEIRMFGGNFAPNGWMYCNGQLLSIAEYSTLFNIIGTTYGGDGQNTFGLPNLVGRFPVHSGSGSGLTFVIGSTGGATQIAVGSSNMPPHNHPLVGSSGPATLADPGGAFLSTPLRNGPPLYNTSIPNVALSPVSVGFAGNAVPISRSQPYLTVSFIISLFGVYPSQG
jgi:microcystin-dependent protein